MSFQAGTCPSCKAVGVGVKYRAFEARQHFGNGTLKCVSYSCAQCDAVLSVETDPLAMMTDLTERIAKRMGKR